MTNSLAHCGSLFPAAIPTVGSWLSYLIDWLSAPVLVLLIGIFLWRKLYREYPLFFSYLVVTELAGIARFWAISRGAVTYFYAYWISDLIITVFNFLAIYELFVRRIFPKFYKIGWYRFLFPILLAMAIFLAWVAAMAPHNVSALAIEDRILDAAIVAILMFFGVLMLIMGRQWTRYDFSIAFGFAVNASAFLLSTTFWAHSNYGGFSIDLPVIAYDISALIWLFSFWSAEKTPEQAHAAISPELVSEARAWQSVLRNWISSKKG